jgi:phage terminase large subunit-like protein
VSASAELATAQLEPFQRRIVRALNGPEQEQVFLLPRGSGKTTLMAMCALQHLVTTPRAQVYCAAASREQASILFQAAQMFARGLAHPNLVDRHLELRFCPDPGEPRVFSRFLRVLHADAPRLHGLTASLSIVDEYQAHPSDDVYIALASAMHKRRGAKLVTISTAGAGVDSPLGKLRARALAQPKVTRRGKVTDCQGEHLRMLEWACGEDDNVDNVRVVKAANPASWVSVDQLRAQRAALPDGAFRRYICNQWVAAENAWLPVGAWQSAVGEPTFKDGEAIWLGVDAGGTKAATAVCWINEAGHVGCAIFHGDEGILRAVETIEWLAERYTIRSCAADPWRMQQAMLELDQRGIQTVKFPMSDSRAIPASQVVYQAIVERRLVLPDDPELASHAANAVAKQSRRGWRIERGAGNIDAIHALMMALSERDLAQQQRPPRLVGWL